MIRAVLGPQVGMALFNFGMERLSSVQQYLGPEVQRLFPVVTTQKLATSLLHETIGQGDGAQQFV
jgi:hypothetical protein